MCGREEVAAQLAHGTRRVQSIEISACRIPGSDEIAYLTAHYKTTFSSAEQPAPKQLLGSHLWILQKRDGVWLVTLVSWSDKNKPSPGRRHLGSRYLSTGYF